MTYARLWKRVTAAAVVAVALVSGACGGDEAPKVAPKTVPDGLVPDAVQNGAFKFYENTTEDVKKAFAEGGARSLAADGRLFELRKGDRLIGTLQLSTLMPEVDVRKPRHRNPILHQVMPATRDEFVVDDTVVFTTISPEKSLYMWFGEGVYAVLQLKGREEGVDADAIVTDIVKHEVQSENFTPVYFDEE